MADHARACVRCGGTGKVVDDKSFGAAVRAQRIGLGLSLRDVEKATRVSRAHVSDMERGKRAFTGRSGRLVLAHVGMELPEFTRPTDGGREG